MEELILLGLKDQQVSLFSLSKGYLSFLNDSISYVLRGLILIELALRNKISIVKESRRRNIADRLIEVCDSSSTGEIILDEALRIIKTERQSTANWIDLLSGETWNPMKVGYQLRQVRERLAKGLVDKGILRTEKHNFLFFDMPTHPISDPSYKAEIQQRLIDSFQGRGSIPSIRTIVLSVAVTAANLLPKLTCGMGFSTREAIASKADELIREFSNISERIPSKCNNEIVAAVLNIFTKMDNLLY